MFVHFSLAICYLVVVSGSSSPSKSSSSPIEEYPYVVSIEYEGRYIGGGSIIDRYFVLTTYLAATASGESIVTVRAGSNFYHKGGSVHNLCTIRTFTPEAMGDSVALIRLVEPIVFDGFRQPIRMFRPTDRARPDAKVAVSAWPVGADASMTSRGPLRTYVRSIRDCTAAQTSVYCLERPADFAVSYSGKGSPVDYEGLLIGIVITSADNTTYAVDVAAYSDSVYAETKAMLCDKCLDANHGNSCP